MLAAAINSRRKPIDRPTFPRYREEIDGGSARGVWQSIIPQVQFDKDERQLILQGLLKDSSFVGQSRGGWSHGQGLD